MSAQTELASLKPKRKDLVFDLVRELGFNVSDWIATATNPKKIKANPKYCYDWSFVVPDKLAIFNLWHGAMRVDGSDITYEDNFRRNADFHRRNGGKLQWITRGEKLDRHAAEAARHNLPVRVIVVDGWRRRTEDASSDSSRVTGRQIDPVEWHVRSYDASSGDFVLARGAGTARYVDQFDVADAEGAVPTKREVSGCAFVRDPAVRRAALNRAKGKCEYCGAQGFTMANGLIYLETHHVIPLSEGGKDHISNVVAVCPNDHRRAHYCANRETIRRDLIGRIGR